MVFIKILSSAAVLNFDNNKKCFLSRKSSYDFCDTEDWRNGAENSVFHHRNKLHFKIYSTSKQLF